MALITVAFAYGSIANWSELAKLKVIVNSTKFIRAKKRLKEIITEVLNILFNKSIEVCKRFGSNRTRNPTVLKGSRGDCVRRPYDPISDPGLAEGPKIWKG